MKVLLLLLAVGHSEVFYFSQPDDDKSGPQPNVFPAAVHEEGHNDCLVANCDLCVEGDVNTCDVCNSSYYDDGSNNCDATCADLDNETDCETNCLSFTWDRKGNDTCDANRCAMPTGEEPGFRTECTGPPENQVCDIVVDAPGYSGSVYLTCPSDLGKYQLGAVTPWTVSITYDNGMGVQQSEDFQTGDDLSVASYTNCAPGTSAPTVNGSGSGPSCANSGTNTGVDCSARGATEGECDSEGDGSECTFATDALGVIQVGLDQGALDMTGVGDGGTFAGPDCFQTPATITYNLGSETATLSIQTGFDLTTIYDNCSAGFGAPVPMPFTGAGATAVVGTDQSGDGGVDFSAGTGVYAVTDCAADCVLGTDTGNAAEIDCMNGGTASGTIGGCTCTCATGFAGTLCDEVDTAASGSASAPAPGSGSAASAPAPAPAPASAPAEAFVFVTTLSGTDIMCSQELIDAHKVVLLAALPGATIGREDCIILAARRRLKAGGASSRSGTGSSLSVILEVAGDATAMATADGIGTAAVGAGLTALPGFTVDSAMATTDYSAACGGAPASAGSAGSASHVHGASSAGASSASAGGGSAGASSASAGAGSGSDSSAGPRRRRRLPAGGSGSASDSSAGASSGSASAGSAPAPGPGPAPGSASAWPHGASKHKLLCNSPGHGSHGHHAHDGHAHGAPATAPAPGSASGGSQELAGLTPLATQLQKLQLEVDGARDMRNGLQSELDTQKSSGVYMPVMGLVIVSLALLALIVCGGSLFKYWWRHRKEGDHSKWENSEDEIRFKNDGYVDGGGEYEPPREYAGSKNHLRVHQVGEPSASHSGSHQATRRH